MFYYSQLTYSSVGTPKLSNRSMEKAVEDESPLPKVSVIRALNLCITKKSTSSNKLFEHLSVGYKSHGTCVTVNEDTTTGTQSYIIQRQSSPCV